MEAALWAFYQASDFKSGALAAVNLGNDADTVGAVYGQLAGAYFGLSGIPGTWVNQLYDAGTILEIAITLRSRVGRIEISEESSRPLADLRSSRPD
jgi:ADP-ribosyl-[dinitrogen reductase] hydrolase